LNKLLLYFGPGLVGISIMLISATVHGDTKSLYESRCTACHGFGIAGAPMLGDKDAWAPRVAQGSERLYDNAINGFTGDTGIMPPKGGFTDLTDEQVKAIVDYMVSEGQ
jgi:cytochrome c5